MTILLSSAERVPSTRMYVGMTFEQAVESYRPQLVRIAAGKVGSLHAEDVVQEALLRAYRARTRPHTSWRAWLIVAVRRVCIDHLERRGEPGSIANPLHFTRA